MRPRLPRRPASAAASLRRDLKLTQEQCANLLNVSKNTWIRWEHGQCQCDRMALELLPILARKSVPAPCQESRAKRYDPEWLAEHIGSCWECRLTVKYVVIVGRPGLLFGEEFGDPSSLFDRP
jgi:transcriptional regulator with XRE-family HTH domain